MTDNIIESKTITGVSTLQKILHLAEVVQVFHCSNNRNPTASELQQLTLLDFQDGENASAAQKASNEKEREAVLKELSDSNVRKYVTILNHLYNKHKL